MKLCLVTFLLSCLTVFILIFFRPHSLSAEQLPQNRASPTPDNRMREMRGKDRVLAQQLLDEAQAQKNIGPRMKVISGRLLGFPYIARPLKGSFKEAEQFVTRMDGFDCMTYVETVLALSGASCVEQFLDRLRELRYKDGEISYAKRLHYATDWHKANVARGVLQDVTQGEDTIECVKTLSLLKGFQPRTTSFRFFPKSRLNVVSKWLGDGDVIYFVTSRNGLDTYHLGLIFREGTRIVMRHAALSRRKVIEQDLAEFCRANQMQGFIIARPIG